LLHKNPIQSFITQNLTSNIAMTRTVQSKVCATARRSAIIWVRAISFGRGAETNRLEAEILVQEFFTALHCPSLASGLRCSVPPSVPLAVAFVLLLVPLMSTAPAAAAASGAAPAATAAAVAAPATHAGGLPAPIQIETTYSHSTFLDTLTNAFAAALKTTTLQQLEKLPAAERDDIVPEYYVEATRQALRQVLAQQYSPGQTAHSAGVPICTKKRTCGAAGSPRCVVTLLLA
jgi:hypothetical protein